MDLGAAIVTGGTRGLGLLTARKLAEQGFVPETIAEHMTGLRRLFYRHVLARLPFARSAGQGAANTVYAATDASLEGISGRFIADRAFKTSSEESHDKEKVRRLWELSCGWCGIEAFGQSER